jgi:hypothetical protein
MDMKTRRQYFQILQRQYHNAKTRQQKSAILNEYCKNTGQNRKYAIQKFNSFLLSSTPRKKRSEIYDSQVIAALYKILEIFDYPCGQRLVSSLRKEIDRLRAFGEIKISDMTAEKLKKYLLQQ